METNYKIFWVNMGYWSQEVFPNYSDAIKYIKEKGFEGVVWEHKGTDNFHSLIASWSPIGGTRWY